MTRGSTVSYEQVAEIATQLETAGDKPSARKIRGVLGTGSFGTIQDHLDDWRKEHVLNPAPEPTHPHPPQLLAEIDRAIAAAQLRVRQELESELLELRTEVAELTAALRSCDADASALSSELDNRSKERDSLVAMLQVRTEQLEEAKQQFMLEEDNFAVATENMRAFHSAAQERAVAAEVRLDAARQEIETLAAKCGQERERREDADRRAITAETRLESAQAMSADLEERIQQQRAAAQALQADLRIANSRWNEEVSRSALAQASQQALEREVVLMRELLRNREEEAAAQPEAA